MGCRGTPWSATPHRPASRPQDRLAVAHRFHRPMVVSGLQNGQTPTHAFDADHVRVQLSRASELDASCIYAVRCVIIPMCVTQCQKSKTSCRTPPQSHHGNFTGPIYPVAVEDQPIGCLGEIANGGTNYPTTHHSHYQSICFGAPLSFPMLHCIVDTVTNAVPSYLSQIVPQAKATCL